MIFALKCILQILLYTCMKKHSMNMVKLIVLNFSFEFKKNDYFNILFQIEDLRRDIERLLSIIKRKRILSSNLPFQSIDYLTQE